MGSPTKKARLMLAVSQPLHATVKELSELQGRPMAAICTDFLEAALPALVELVGVLKRAAALPDEGKAAVLDAISAAEPSVRTLSAELDGQLELIDLAVIDAEVAARKRA